MHEGAWFDVYLSYRDADRKLAGKIFAELVQRNHAHAGGGKLRVYMDTVHNKPGLTWGQQVVQSLTHASVFVPIVSRAALAKMAGCAPPAEKDDKNPPVGSQLHSEELRFDQRLDPKNEPQSSEDPLLLEWQLALTLLQLGQSDACQHVLPLMVGRPVHEDVYANDSAAEAPVRKLVGFESFWGEMKSNQAKQFVGLRGLKASEVPAAAHDPAASADARDDDDGYFGDAPLPLHKEKLAQLQVGPNEQRLIDRAGQWTPVDVVRRVFDLQAKFADQLVPRPKTDAPPQAERMVRVPCGRQDSGTFKRFNYPGAAEGVYQIGTDDR